MTTPHSTRAPAAFVTTQWTRVMAARDNGAAFAQIVRCHANLVYAAVLRQVAVADLAAPLHGNATEPLQNNFQ
jgi:hypothetical protein